MRKIKTKIKKPELVAARREQIVRAAFILFRKNGYHATTLREICEKSKVNRASIYDYFRSKADILIYIYKLMMYSEGKFDEAFPDVNISGWKDLEPFIRKLISYSWSINKHGIQLVYRETNSLDPQTKKDVLSIESDYIKWVAENLRKGLGVSSITEELEIMANTMVYFNHYIPMRGWNMHHIDQEKIEDFVVEMLMVQLKSLRRRAKKR